jgi:hypothetical protein
MTLGSTESLTETNTRNILRGKWLAVRKAGNLAAVYEPTSRKHGSLDLSKMYWPPWPVTGLALPFFYPFTAKRVSNLTTTIRGVCPCL